MPFPFRGDGECPGPQVPAGAMGTAMPARIRCGQVIAGVGQFMQQGNPQQFDFLTHLQTDAQRVGPAVGIASQ